jgi:uncharacterized protein
MKAPPKNSFFNTLAAATRRIENETSALVDRLALGSILDQGNGSTYDRNLNEECRYPDPITLDHLYEMNNRELGNRVNSVESEATWEDDPEIRENEQSRNTPFEKKYEDLVVRTQAYHYLSKVDRLSGIGRFGVLFYGFNDGNDPKTPVSGIDRDGNRVENDLDPDLDLLYLRAFDEKLVKVVMTEKNKRSWRYQLPTQYEILLGGEENSTVEGGVSDTSGGVWTKIHWSRILHVADNCDSGEIYGVPRQKPVYNRLHDLRKTLGGAAEMFYRGAFPGISFEMLPDFDEPNPGDDTDTAFRQQIEQYMQGIRRYISLRGYVAKSLAPQVADPSKHVEEQLRALCAILKVPMRVFLGTEAGQLASEQDAKAWNKRIGKRKRKYVEPRILRPFIGRLQTVGVLPQVDSYKVVWSDPETVSDKDQAEIIMKKAQAIGQYASMGGETVVPIREFLSEVFNLSVDKVDAITAALDKQGKKYRTPGAQKPLEPVKGTSPKDPAKKTGRKSNAQARR